MTGSERAALEILREAAQPLGGLEIVKLSAGTLHRGTVYIVLQRLMDAGLVTAQDTNEPSPWPDLPPRRLFSLTEDGRRALADVPGTAWSPA